MSCQSKTLRTAEQYYGGLVLYFAKFPTATQVPPENGSKAISQKAKTAIRQRRASSICPTSILLPYLSHALIFQAVVLCDVYSHAFEPLSIDLNPILFPLGGSPILAYTLEFLERGGVEEVILICSTHATQIQSCIDSSRWGEKGYPVKVRVVIAAAAKSVGDALREIDRLGLVKTDFVLIRGGILSNLALPSMVEEHRKRKEVDKDGLLMTMVLMEDDSHSSFGNRRYFPLNMLFT
jgi:hypothetical protein